MEATVVRRLDARSIFQPALAGVRTYWPAFLIIQLAALALVLAYFRLPAFREWCAVIGEWKMRGGIGFAAAANVISGGVIPELLKAPLRPPGVRPPSVRDLLHTFVMFAVLGIGIERFYALQDVLFGSGTGLRTLLPKILLDQFGYTLFIALPFVVVWFLWREQHYNFAATVRACRAPVVVPRVLQIFASNVAFWGPMLFLVYALPQSLQFLLFLVVNSAWCLLMVFMARRQVGE